MLERACRLGGAAHLAQMVRCLFRCVCVAAVRFFGTLKPQRAGCKKKLFG